MAAKEEGLAEVDSADLSEEAVVPEEDAAADAVADVAEPRDLPPSRPDSEPFLMHRARNAIDSEE